MKKTLLLAVPLVSSVCLPNNLALAAYPYNDQPECRVISPGRAQCSWDIEPSQYGKIKRYATAHIVITCQKTENDDSKRNSRKKKKNHQANQYQNEQYKVEEQQSMTEGFDTYLTAQCKSNEDKILNTNTYVNDIY